MSQAKGRGSKMEYPVGRQKLRGAVALFRNREEPEMWAHSLLPAFSFPMTGSHGGIWWGGEVREGLFWISGA